MTSRLATLLSVSACCVFAFGQETQPPAAPDFTVEPGTHIPLSLINSVSTKNAAPGDRVYLQTAFPVLDHGHIVIPAGSYVDAVFDAAGRLVGLEVIGATRVLPPEVLAGAEPA